MCFALFFLRYTPQKTYVTFVPYVFFSILAPFITQAPLRVERTAPAAPVQWVQRVQVFRVAQCPNIMGNSDNCSEMPIIRELTEVNVLASSVHIFIDIDIRPPLPEDDQPAYTQQDTKGCC